LAGLFFWVLGGANKVTQVSPIPFIPFVCVSRPYIIALIDKGLLVTAEKVSLLYNRHSISIRY